MKPFVSVCIPVYSQIPFLRKTLESIQAQEFTDYELVISDDSPDSSVQELLKDFDFSGKLIYSKNAIALGSPANWNRAVDLSSGALIKIMHHDDWFSSPDSLGEFVNLIGEDQKVGFAFSGVNTKRPYSDLYTHQYASPKNIDALKINPMPLMLRNCIGPPSSTIIRREYFKRYRENLKWLVDVFQYAEILDKTKFTFTSKALVYSTTDAEHQITNSCQNNPGLLIYEYLYFFDHIKTLGQINLDPYVAYLNELVLKYEIKRESEIRQYGFMGDIPSQTLKIIGLPSLGRRLKLLELKIRRKANDVLRAMV
ncbi:glycosyltransferase [Polynucleobacter sp. MWH-UH19D]|uniref:glycosyltransferase family 2 protein n=1 Tax=Polynucleobacter sp. MWH-UH19D TaxID=1855610 RepID=UPI003364BA89